MKTLNEQTNSISNILSYVKESNIEKAKSKVDKTIKEKAYNHLCLELKQSLNLDFNETFVTTIVSYYQMQSLKDSIKENKKELLESFKNYDINQELIKDFAQDFTNCALRLVKKQDKLEKAFREIQKGVIEEVALHGTYEALEKNLKVLYGVEKTENTNYSIIKGMLFDNGKIVSSTKFYKTLNSAFTQLLQSDGNYLNGKRLGVNYATLTKDIKIVKYSDVYTTNGNIRDDYKKEVLKKHDFKVKSNTDTEKKCLEFMRDDNIVVTHDSLFEKLEELKK